MNLYYFELRIYIKFYTKQSEFNLLSVKQYLTKDLISILCLDNSYFIDETAKFKTLYNLYQHSCCLFLQFFLFCIVIVFFLQPLKINKQSFFAMFMCHFGMCIFPFFVHSWFFCKTRFFFLKMFLLWAQTI